MMKVSNSTPSDMAKPSSIMLRSVPVAIEPKVPAMITPQLVMMPPVRTTASRSPAAGRGGAAPPRPA